MYDDAAQQWRLDDVHAYVEVLLRRRSDPAEMRPSRSLQRFNGDYPSMYLGFAGCAFEDNRVGVSLLNNAGGLLDVTKSHFGNNVAPSLIFNIQQARLALHGGTSFVNNSGLGIGPISRRHLLHFDPRGHHRRQQRQRVWPLREVRGDLHAATAFHLERLRQRSVGVRRNLLPLGAGRLRRPIPERRRRFDQPCPNAGADAAVAFRGWY